MSTPENQARAIFLAAIERPVAAERAEFIALACGGDAELKLRVERLVQSHEQLGSFHDEPPAAETFDLPAAELPGTQIGPYKLLQQIGEGGMGVVYMAEQLEPVKRRVALKIIKPGMDTRQVIARFEAERQALSLMDHPNIAKVLDAGATESGRPYFVMELVKGQPITQYCDEKHLTPRQRLELLLPVCQAIQHAHQKGIIHRDIKPTNILVAEYDQQPVPKVIDFGVAKATSQTLTEKTMFTGLGQIVGTLEYMSPEQAKVNQLDIDTRSDIYSLGVLLYELLTGSTPFDKQRLRSAAFDEMLRIIREEEPPKPSTRLSDSHDSLPSISAQRHTEPAKLTKLVRGELDWVVMKALEKDRNRRYETASAFAADLQHYLSDEPVIACPPSAMYRFRKFARRNQGRLAVASVLAVALLVAVSGIGWGVRDRAAREAGSKREQEARQAKVAGQVESILVEVEQLEREQNWPDALAAARRAATAVTSGEADAQTTEQVQQRLKELEFIDRLEQIRMQSMTWYKGLAWDSAREDRAYGQAFRDYGVDVDELAVETSINRLKARPAFAISLAAVLDRWAARRTDSDSWKRLVTIARGIDPEPLRDRTRAARWLPLSEIPVELRRLVDSIDVRTQHPITVLLLAKGVEDPQVAIRILQDAQEAHPEDFWLNFNLGHDLQKQYAHEGAVRFYTAALSIRPTSVAAHNNLGNVLRFRKQFDEAIRHYRKAIELDPKSAMAHSNLGLALQGQKKLEDALAHFKKALEIDPDYAVAHNNLGVLLCEDLKDYENGIACLRRAIELDPIDANSCLLLGNVLLARGKPDEAIVAYRKAIEARPEVAHYYWRKIGDTLRVQKKRDEAIAAYRKATAANPKDAVAHLFIGAVLHEQKKFDEAIAAYRKAIEIEPSPGFAAGRYFSIGKVLEDQGKLDEAIASFRKAAELEPNYAVAHSCLAWLLTNCREAKFRDAAGGLAAAQKAVEVQPKSSLAWQVLGWARYRREDWKVSIEALEKSCALDDEPKGGSAFQWFFLAMAHRRIGEKEKAREWYNKAAHWMEANAKDNSDLIRFRAEAEELMKEE